MCVTTYHLTEERTNYTFIINYLLKLIIISIPIHITIADGVQE